MQTSIDKTIISPEQGKEADRILRSCVHCGFCNATCPTYQLLGDELDGPRGRIYQIKQVLEGKPGSRKTQLHLDRCLTCLACETTCPSGVDYRYLLDIGREVIEEKNTRPVLDRLKRKLLRKMVIHSRLFAYLITVARLFRFLLPGKMKSLIPVYRVPGRMPEQQHQRKMIILDGCVQPALAPNINAATARVLDRLGITLLHAQAAGCCGAMSHHLAAGEEAREQMRRNIDAWWPLIDDGVEDGAGAEAIIITASACGAMVKDYGYHLRGDNRYALKAARVSELARDISEIVYDENSNTLDSLTNDGLIDKNKYRKIAYHAPCSLQHGQKITGIVESLLKRFGLILTTVPDSHLCCGAAGSYSIFQEELSDQLLQNKIQALCSGSPEMIVSANIGCLGRLASKSDVPVVHWIELLDQLLNYK